MTQTTAELLKRAKEKINTPDKWYQGDHTPDGLGLSMVNNGGPCCMDAAIMWACQKECYAKGTPEGDASNILHKLSDGDFVNYNDHPETTHDDIMALFDRAIELAEGE